MRGITISSSHPPLTDDPKATAYRLFMLVVSVVSLLVVTALFVLPQDGESRRLLMLLDWLVCGVFFVDFLGQLRRAESKWRYLRGWGWVDLLACVPAVDALRYGRAFRPIRLVQLLRGVRSVRHLASIIKHYRARATVAITALVVFLAVTIGSMLVLHFELEVEGSQIRTAEDALWWTWVTITTVGYGDFAPETTGGRLVAAALMTVGVGLFSAISGLIASWLLEPREEVGA